MKFSAKLIQQKKLECFASTVAKVYVITVRVTQGILKTVQKFYRPSIRYKIVQNISNASNYSIY